MKNYFGLILTCLLLIATNGCGILKNKSQAKSKITEKITTEKITNEVKTDNSVLQTRKASNSKFVDYTEEVSIKKMDPLKYIELFATFKVDSAAMINPNDTILKLVDVKNDNVSLSVYQNKKTKEIMAKVNTPAGNTTTPFSEINIKRRYQSKEQSDIDSSLMENNISDVIKTTQNEKKEAQSISKTSNKEVKNSVPIGNILIILLVAMGVIAFIWYKRN